MSPDEAVRRFAVAVALWNVGTVDSTGVVDAAVDVLLAGVPGPTLDIVAGVPARRAAIDLLELLPAACAELHISFHRHGTDEAMIAAAGALSFHVLEGQLTAAELASWVHGAFGHDGPPLTARLAELDDQYDLRPATSGIATDDLDADVRAIATQLAAQFQEALQHDGRPPVHGRGS